MPPVCITLLLCIVLVCIVQSEVRSSSTTVEKTTLKELLDGLIYSKYNCFWRVVEGTRRFVIEHISDRNNSNVIDFLKYLQIKREKN